MQSNQTEVTYASVEVQTAEENQGMINKVIICIQ